MKKRLAALVAATAAMLIGWAPGALAANHDGTCNAGEMCLYEAYSPGAGPGTVISDNEWAESDYRGVFYYGYGWTVNDSVASYTNYADGTVCVYVDINYYGASDCAPSWTTRVHWQLQGTGLFKTGSSHKWISF